MAEQTPQPGAELASDYYLTNFLTLIRGVTERSASLLSDDERHWLRRLQALTRPQQQLLVRLLSRKGPLFRLDKLNYPEIADLPGCADALVAAGLARDHAPRNWVELASLCTKAELLQLAPDGDRRLRKPELVASLAQRPLPKTELRLIALEGAAILDTLKLLFFGNRHQDLAQFVISDLGIQRFESYPLTAEGCGIDSRQALEAWLSLGELADECQRLMERRERDALVALTPRLPKPLPWPELERKRQKLALLLAREWERREAFDQALALYRQSDLTPARERRARIALKQGHPQRALAEVTAMLASPSDEQEATVASRLGKQLARGGHWHWSPLPLRTAPGESLTLEDSGERVELQVAAHYQALGWQVHYCENALLNGLLGLVLWPALFAPVTGAFFNPYQMGPRDLHHREFVARRSAIIETQLSGWRPDELLARYDDKQGILNPLVQWEWAPRSLIASALQVLPRELLDACFRRMLFDLPGNRSGHPDLFLVRDGRARWLEVKGPGDRLQDNQSRWLRFLEDQGADVAVCQVSYR